MIETPVSAEFEEYLAGFVHEKRPNGGQRALRTPHHRRDSRLLALVPRNSPVPSPTCLQEPLAIERVRPEVHRDAT